SELGYQKLASWTYEMELEELEQLAHIKEGEKEKAEIKEKHFGFLESQFNATLKQLPAAFEQAYEEGEKVYEAFGDYLNEQEGASKTRWPNLWRAPNVSGWSGTKAGLWPSMRSFGKSWPCAGRSKIM